MPARKNPNNLSGRDLRIFNLHMRGLKNIEIADLLGITKETVSNCLAMESIKEAKQDVLAKSIEFLSSDESTESAVTIARANSARLMRRQVQIAESSKSEAVALRAIHDILDRSLGKPTQRVVVDKMEEIMDSLSAEQLEHYGKTGELPENLEIDASRTESNSVH